jgi:hypothetical protein
VRRLFLPRIDGLLEFFSKARDEEWLWTAKMQSAIKEADADYKPAN